MPFNDSYSSLQLAVQEWAKRVNSEATLIARIPDFILITETRLNRDLEIESMLQLQFVDTVPLQEWLAIPTRFKRMRSIRMTELNPIVSLKYRTPAQLDATPGANRSGKPAYFSISGDRIRLGPIPDAVYRIEQYFWQTFPVLSATQSTNWWLENAPDALLYGALLEMAPYLKAADELAVWEARFEKAKVELLHAADEFLWAGELTVQVDYNLYEQPRA